jgi:hypothetical protein
MEPATGEQRTNNKYPWDDYGLTYTGIPPHVAVLYEIRHASKEQTDF